MESGERVEELKRAYSEGVIDVSEFEREVEEALEKSSRKNRLLNTSDSLDPQIWMSHEQTNVPDPAELKSVDGEMHLPIKPTGGMWTSTYTPDAEYDSDWIRWCSTEGFISGRHKWRLEPKENLEVLVVDSLEDLRIVSKAYKKETYKGMDASLLSEAVLDFTAIAEDFDAMRLTEEGQWDTRLTETNEPSLYGWDSETVLNFRWNWVDFEYMNRSDIEPLADTDIEV